MEITENKQQAGFGFYLKNLILISIFWTVCSIPIFTIGASTCAMYRTVHKVLYMKEVGTWRVFKESFTSNFKKGTKCWIVILIFGAIFFGIGRYLLQMDIDSGGSDLGMYYIMFYILFAYVFLWGMYTLSYNVRFNDPARVILRNCLYLVVRHLMKTIIMGVILAVFIFFTIRWPFLLIIGPALSYFIIFRIMESVFRVYMSENDARMIWGLEPVEESEENYFDQKKIEEEVTKSEE